MTSFNIYLLFLIGNIDKGSAIVFGFTMGGAIIFAIVYGFCSGDVRHDDRAAYKKMGIKYLKIIITVLSITFGVSVLCPSTEQLAVIYLLPKLSNSKLVNTLPAYAQTFLDLEIKKLKKETMEVSK